MKLAERALFISKQVKTGDWVEYLIKKKESGSGSSWYQNFFPSVKKSNYVFGIFYFSQILYFIILYYAMIKSISKN